MTVISYYNENDPKAAAWLNALIDAGLIPFGWVDERSITEIISEPPEFFNQFTQCHFFAGIGGWPLALQMAGWPADLPVWTGSCPCQPFSVAGKQKGIADERHLWPYFAHIIDQCRPPAIFGEQVSGKAGCNWLAGVRTDLENSGYAVGAADLCAACSGEKAEGWVRRGDTASGVGQWEPTIIGAPHIRQRLFWMAYAECAQWRSEGIRRTVSTGRFEETDQLRGIGSVGGLANNSGGFPVNGSAQGQVGGAGGISRLGDTESTTGQPKFRAIQESQRQDWQNSIDGFADSSPMPFAGAWSEFLIIPCRDGKHRRIPTEPAFFPLADGLPGRVAQLRGLGNAIVPPLAAEFIQSCCEAIGVLSENSP